MTIDEAIEHCKSVAGNGNCKCALEHKQLAEWLEKAKASQWHYPSKGELPPGKEDLFFCRLKIQLGDWSQEWYELLLWTGKDWCRRNASERVIAWQYIIPPKEEA